jgi:uncharacterized iron-regulated membrane protein
MKKPLLLWHRWFGIIGGIWLLLIAVTGSILVFYQELDRAFNPQLFHASSTQPDGTQWRIAAAIAAAEATIPGAMASYTRLPAAAGETLIVNLVDRPGHAGAVGPRGREVFVDPVTAQVTGSRVWGAPGLAPSQFMPMLYRLHYALLAGATIEWLLGLVALAWLVDHVAAVPLALRTVQRWPDALRIRLAARGHRRIFDLHRAGALLLLPITAMLAFTGVYFNLNSEFRTVLALVSPPSANAGDTRPALPRPLIVPPVNADTALARARSEVLGAAVTGISLDHTRGLWVIDVTHPRDPSPDYGGRSLVVDARTAAVLADQHFSTGSAADVVMAWQYPLHSGRAFGWPGRLLVLLAGIVTALLVITGYRLWWTRWRARHTAATRRTSAAVARPAQPAAMPAE